MCCCSSSKPKTRADALASSSDGLKLRVDDMTCGHCAGVIEKAIETGLPGARVTADPASKLVTVQGVKDLDAVTALVIKAGYTPAIV